MYEEYSGLSWKVGKDGNRVKERKAKAWTKLDAAKDLSSRLGFTVSTSSLASACQATGCIWIGSKLNEFSREILVDGSPDLKQKEYAIKNRKRDLRIARDLADLILALNARDKILVDSISHLMRGLNVTVPSELETISPYALPVPLVNMIEYLYGSKVAKYNAANNSQHE
jgi:hypothetical protein